jgi:WD40 repeat protein
MSDDSEEVFASASDDKKVRLWRGIGKSPTATLLGHTEKVNCVALSADG